MKAAKILSTLTPTDYLYKKKVGVLAQLIQDKDGGHIIDSCIFDLLIDTRMKKIVIQNIQ